MKIDEACDRLRSAIGDATIGSGLRSNNSTLTNLKTGLKGNNAEVIDAAIGATVEFLKGNSPRNPERHNIIQSMVGGAVDHAAGIEDPKTSLKGGDRLFESLRKIRSSIDEGLTRAGIDVNDTKNLAYINMKTLDIPAAMQFGVGSNQGMVNGAIAAVQTGLMK